MRENMKGLGSGLVLSPDLGGGVAMNSFVEPL